MKYSKTINFLTIFGILISLQSYLIGSSWSLPAEVIYPQQDLKNGTTPFIATSENGNSVAVWYDIEGTMSGYGSMKGAVLTFDIEKSKPIWTLTSPIAPINVQLPFSPIAQSVGMDAKGNAIAVWADKNDQIRAAQLLAGSTSWTLFPEPLNQCIDRVNSPSIAIASNGNAVVIWASITHSFDTYLYANVFDSQTNQWRGEIKIFKEVLQNFSNINQVVINPQGDALAVASSTVGSIQASKFNFKSNNWRNIISLPIHSLSEQVFVSAALDPKGNAAFVWVLDNHSLFSTFLFPNQKRIVNQVLLSKDANNLFSYPSIKFDGRGNAIAVWSEDLNGLGSARYSASTQSWNRLPPLDLNNNIPINISLAVDGRGNAVAIWSIFTDGGSFVQAAVLPNEESSWKLLTQLTPSSGQNLNPQVIITSDGNAISIWENDIGLFFSGSINSSTYLNLFPLDSLPQISQ